MDSVNVDLVLTHACNFRCTYCYEKDTPYIKDIDPSVLEEFPNFVRRLHDHFDTRVSITYWGGEPTLKSEEIIKVTNDLKDLNYVNFGLITNAYDIEKLKPLFLDFKNRDNEFYLQVSYDFSPNQEKNRLEAISRDGKKAKEKILQNVKWLAENNIPFSTKSTIRPEDLPNVDKVYFDFQNFKKMVTEYSGSRFTDRLAITIDTYQNPTKQEIEKILEPFHDAMINILSYQIANNINNDFNFLSPDRRMCSVHHNICAVDIDGSIYPCHTAIFTQEKEMHKMPFNIFDPDINNLFISESYKEGEGCEGCTACFCLKCNVHCFSRSKKEAYCDRMTDFANSETSCFLYKEVSKFTYAREELIRSL